jgi:adenylate cyclase
MFDELCWRLVADRLPLLRATLHMGTLHPLTRSTGIRWLREPKIIEEYRVLQGQEATDEYLRSPIRVTTEAKDAVDPKPTPTQAQSSRSGHLRRSRNTAVQDVGNPDGPPQCHS